MRSCLLVAFVSAPTDCSSYKAKFQYYRDLSRLLWNMCSTAVAVVVNIFYTQLLSGYRTITQGLLNNNGDSLTQVCSEHRLLLEKRWLRLTRSLLSPSHIWVSVGHIATSRGWCGSIEGFQSFWSRPMDTDHALLLARFCFPQVSPCIRAKIILYTQLILDVSRGFQF